MERKRRPWIFQKLPGPSLLLVWLTGCPLWGPSHGSRGPADRRVGGMLLPSMQQMQIPADPEPTPRLLRGQWVSKQEKPSTLRSTAAPCPVTGTDCWLQEPPGHLWPGKGFIRSFLISRIRFQVAMNTALHFHFPEARWNATSGYCNWWRGL